MQSRNSPRAHVQGDERSSREPEVLEELFDGAEQAGARERRVGGEVVSAQGSRPPASRAAAGNAVYARRGRAGGAGRKVLRRIASGGRGRAAGRWAPRWLGGARGSPAPAAPPCRSARAMRGARGAGGALAAAAPHRLRRRRALAEARAHKYFRRRARARLPSKHSFWRQNLGYSCFSRRGVGGSPPGGAFAVASTRTCAARS